MFDKRMQEFFVTVNTYTTKADGTHPVSLFSVSQSPSNHEPMRVAGHLPVAAQAVSPVPYPGTSDPHLC